MFKFSDTAKILIILILLFIPWLGLRDFQSRGESREALVALSMYNTSDYILPLSYSDTIPSKPPLLHWLINLSIETFGSVNEFVFRLPVALASIIFLFYFYQFLLRNKPEVAFISTLILATSFQWFRHTTLVRVDLLLSVGISLAVFALYDYIVNKRRSLLLVYLGLTIAILSKGPVGILLPFIIFSSWAYLGRTISLKSYFGILSIFFLSTLSGAIWYNLAYITDGQAFIDKVWYENAERMTSSMADEPHKNSILYLYASFFWSLLPWSFLWLGNLTNLKNKISSLFENSFLRLNFLFILVFIIFFSIPSGKRDVYLMPCLPSAAIFLAIIFTHTTNKIKNYYKIFYKSLIFISFISIFLVFSLNSNLVTFIKNYHFDELISYFTSHIDLLIYSTIAVACIHYLLYKEEFTKKIFADLISLLIIVQSLFLPAIANAISYKNVAQESSIYVIDDSKLYSFDDAFYGLSFYLNKKFYEFDYESNIKLPNGKYFLFKKNIPKLEARINPRCYKLIKDFSKPMTRSDKFVSLIEVYDCGK
jgi:hypothetical protein